MFKQKFATNLKNIRKSRRLTQEQLAEAVGVDFRYISYIENAKSFPSCDLIQSCSVLIMKFHGKNWKITLLILSASLKIKN